jgi:D-arabinose 1-dehydrogenase-like Zn-dependent alcohol dehydrogenase
MRDGERLVVVGGGGVGSPAAMMARKLMPEVQVTLIREEDTFIVR